MTRGLSNRCNPARALGWNAPMPSSALLFPGQGSHAEGMEEPYRDHPVLERGLELLGYDPFERLTEGTRYQQPALFLCSVAAWEQWREEADDEDEARAAAGHSLGEYAALVAAGALRFDDAVRLVDERAAAMADAGDLNPGGMVAILGGDARAVRALASRLGLIVANDNAPGQLVLSGPIDAVAEAEDLARDEAGARARRLDVTGAFHSPLMEPAAERLHAALEATPISEPQIPVYSNGTASPFVDIRRELAQNLLRGVRWRETLLAMRTAGIERRLDTPDEWIVRRTGIRERRPLAPDEPLADLAARACLLALDDAGRAGAEVDQVIVSTFTADRLTPGLAPEVARLIGAHGASAVDVNAACAGFLYALDQAAALVESGRASLVLVCGAEALSRVTDHDDRSTAVIFGDGAGAVVVAGREALERAGCTVDDIDLFVAHQANIRIIETAAAELGIPREKVAVNVDRTANTSSASIPLALAQAEEQGLLAPGATVALAAFGAGFVWGAGVISWKERRQACA